MEVLKIQAINRHRFTVDGEGITTLIALYGCPLQCEFCINQDILSTGTYRELTPGELISEIMIDYCYYVATGGGITFGGGEPLLYSKAIREVRNQLPEHVKLNIETSLYVEQENLQDVLCFVDCLIVDVKSLNADIYKRYTGKDIHIMLHNLEYICEKRLQHQCKIRIPHIPEYTSENDVELTVKQIREMGFENIDVFDYVIRDYMRGKITMK